MNLLIGFLIAVFVLAGARPDSFVHRRRLLLACSVVVGLGFYSARVVL